MEVLHGQHYLKDLKIIEKTITKSNISKNDLILEIGPGNGVLTKEILKQNPKKLIAVELDTKHKVELDKLEAENLEVIYDNVLDVFDTLEINKIIANIPYDITEKLYTKIIDREIPEVILLHGIDFYKNILERETRWKYIVPAFYNVELLDEVSGLSFYPPTKVKSALVKLSKKQEYSKFDIFMQMFFYKRTRSLKNALLFSLVDSLQISKKEAKELILDIKLEDSKVSQLSNIEFVRIINKIKVFFEK